MFDKESQKEKSHTHTHTLNSDGTNWFLEPRRLWERINRIHFFLLNDTRDRIFDHLFNSISFELCAAEMSHEACTFLSYGV